MLAQEPLGDPAFTPLLQVLPEKGVALLDDIRGKTTV
jgi:hypothetical protein